MCRDAASAKLNTTYSPRSRYSTSTVYLRDTYGVRIRPPAGATIIDILHLHRPTQLYFYMHAGTNGYISAIDTNE